MTNWYTADPHFGHDNIINYAGRPFNTTGHMDAALIANYASLVQPDDDFWIVGDFGFGHTAQQEGYLASVFERLPGRKHLVVGNHDHSKVRALAWASISNIAEIKDQGQSLVLCHYPMITWLDARKGALQLFGHVHQNWRGTRNSVNVGVDVWGYMPVRLGDIRKRAATQPVNSYWKTVERKNHDEEDEA